MGGRRIYDLRNDALGESGPAAKSRFKEEPGVCRAGVELVLRASVCPVLALSILTNPVVQAVQKGTAAAHDRNFRNHMLAPVPPFGTITRVQSRLRIAGWHGCWGRQAATALNQTYSEGPNHEDHRRFAGLDSGQTAASP
jgi:hypothetical protein